MSEADAGPKEEKPSKEAEEPAPARQIDDRRSSSLDVVAGDNLVLHSIFYNGKPLRLPGTHSHIYGVVFRILRNVCSCVPSLAVALPKDLDKMDRPDNNTILELTKTYNRAAKPFATNWSGSYNTDVLGSWGEPNCDGKVAADITGYAYECAVPRPAELNHYYKSFTSETYGETNLEQMASIIDELRIGSHDVFVDLGSGIGQLVCFTAAYAKCKKCVGIELSQTPATYASDLGFYFKRLMSHYGKNCGKYEHIQGDFLNAKFKKLICEEATVIFINNFAFSPELMFRITTELLQDLKNGTRIVTTKPFGAHTKSITFRSTSDINAISQTIELKSMESGVSWTAKQVKFYCTTMDHTKLIRYYEEEQRKKDPSYKREESSETEQAAASHHSPKWNEPDTDYAPPNKKVKKEKHRDSGEPSSTGSSAKESTKKKKSLSVPKAAKTPKSSKHATESSHRSTASSSASHSVPSQPKATAPPPSASAQQQTAQKQSKVEVPTESELIHGAQLDAKTMSAIHTIREAATTSAQAAAIQDAINSVLSQSTPSPSQQTPALTSTSYSVSQSIPAPVAVYPPAPVAAPPPPQPNVMLPNSDLVAEQRHTFMIPPTDPLYNIIVSYYFGIKKYYNMAKSGDTEIMNQLRMDIEHEKFRRNELNESAQSTNNQIDELLASGVQTLKDRLDKLGMHSVTDVSELLAGSKQIVTQHKGLTTNVTHMENSVALEEQKLIRLGGPGALRCFEDAINQPSMDIMRLTDLVINVRDPNFVPQIIPDDSPSADSKISPSSRRPRQPKPRTTTSSGSKRGNSAGRKSDGNTEDVEMEIQQFVQHALKVDNAVKEKERKARGNFQAAAERIP